MNSDADPDLGYFIGTDILPCIRANEKAAKENNRTLLTKITDYAAYGYAYLQRFTPHVTFLVGLERIIEGKYVEGLMELSVVPLLSEIDRTLTREGQAINNAKSVINYIIGTDIIEYMKVNEPFVKKIEKRNLLSKLMDWQNYAGSFIVRYGINYLHIDGVINLFKGQYKIATAELSIGLWRDFFAYYRHKRRLRFIKLMKAINEQGLIDKILNPKRLDDKTKS